jgi:hypothetical protein
VKFRQPPPRAGVYAESRYQQGLSSWRRALKLPLAIACGPFVAFSVLVYAFNTGDWFVWMAGGLGGVGLALGGMFFDTPPPYVQMWREGAEGERRTERELRPLEASGWRVFHDVEGPYGNYDHIVVGERGVFLIETKNWAGEVSADGGVPTLRRRHDHQAKKRLTDAGRQAVGNAIRVGQELQRRCSRRPFVQAVVCLWAPFPDGPIENQHAVYIHGEQLRTWLEIQPLRHTQAVVRELADAVAHLSIHVSVPAPPAPSVPAQRAFKRS